MPLILIIRFLLSLVSLCIIGATGYLLWTWYQGDYYRDAAGFLVHTRDNWRLWLSLALLAWSFGGGGLVLKPFLAKRDTRRLDPKRGNGALIKGTAGVTLYVEDQGGRDKPCLILTHGWGLDSTIWDYAKRDLADRFRVVTWDLPSLGKSKAPTAAVSLDTFAENLAIVIRHTGARRVVLVGHSIGGMTIQTLARDNPAFVNAHVAGVVLVNTTYHNPLKTMALSGLAQALRFPLIEPLMALTMVLWPLAWLGAWKSYLDGSAHLANRLGFGPLVTHSQLEHTTLLGTRNPQAALAKGNLAMFRWDADGALAALIAPVLVIAGRCDIVTKPGAGAHIAESVPGAELIVVDKANHMGFVERADVYNPAIATFATQAFQDLDDRQGSRPVDTRST